MLAHCAVGVRKRGMVEQLGPLKEADGTAPRDLFLQADSTKSSATLPVTVPPPGESKM